MSESCEVSRERIGFYAGSFNPFTIGHKSIVDRALRLFDRVVIGVGCNIAKAGDSSAAKDREQAIKAVFVSEPRVTVVTYEGLTADVAASMGACALIRGVRSVTDFEAERTLADINRQLTGIDTVILISLPEYGHISSSMVRELLHFGKDVTPYLP